MFDFDPGCEIVLFSFIKNSLFVSLTRLTPVLTQVLLRSVLGIVLEIVSFCGITLSCFEEVQVIRRLASCQAIMSIVSDKSLGFLVNIS